MYYVIMFKLLQNLSFQNIKCTGLLTDRIIGDDFTDINNLNVDLDSVNSTIDVNISNKLGLLIIPGFILLLLSFFIPDNQIVIKWTMFCLGISCFVIAYLSISSNFSTIGEFIEETKGLKKTKNGNYRHNLNYMAEEKMKHQKMALSSFKNQCVTSNLNDIRLYKKYFENVDMDLLKKLQDIISLPSIKDTLIKFYSVKKLLGNNEQANEKIQFMKEFNETKNQITNQFLELNLIENQNIKFSEILLFLSSLYAKINNNNEKININYLFTANPKDYKILKDFFLCLGTQNAESFYRYLNNNNVKINNIEDLVILISNSSENNIMIFKILEEFKKISDDENIDLDQMILLIDQINNQLGENIVETYQKLVNEFFETNKEVDELKIILKDIFGTNNLTEIKSIINVLFKLKEFNYNIFLNFIKNKIKQNQDFQKFLKEYKFESSTILQNEIKKLNDFFKTQNINIKNINNVSTFIKNIQTQQKNICTKNANLLKTLNITNFDDFINCLNNLVKLIDEFKINSKNIKNIDTILIEYNKNNNIFLIIKDVLSYVFNKKIDQKNCLEYLNLLIKIIKESGINIASEKFLQQYKALEQNYEAFELCTQLSQLLKTNNKNILVVLENIITTLSNYKINISDCLVSFDQLDKQYKYYTTQKDHIEKIISHDKILIPINTIYKSIENISNENLIDISKCIDFLYSENNKKISYIEFYKSIQILLSVYKIDITDVVYIYHTIKQQNDGFDAIIALYEYRALINKALHPAYLVMEKNKDFLYYSNLKHLYRDDFCDSLLSNENQKKIKHIHKQLSKMNINCSFADILTQLQKFDKSLKKYGLDIYDPNFDKFFDIFLYPFDQSFLVKYGNFLTKECKVEDLLLLIEDVKKYESEIGDFLINYYQNKSDQIILCMNTLKPFSKIHQFKDIKTICLEIRSFVNNFSKILSSEEINKMGIKTFNDLVYFLRNIIKLGNEEIVKGLTVNGFLKDAIIYNKGTLQIVQNIDFLIQHKKSIEELKVLSDTLKTLMNSNGFNGDWYVFLFNNPKMKIIEKFFKQCLIQTKNIPISPFAKTALKKIPTNLVSFIICLSILREIYINQKHENIIKSLEEKLENINIEDIDAMLLMNIIFNELKIIARQMAISAFFYDIYSNLEQANKNKAKKKWIISDKLITQALKSEYNASYLDKNILGNNLNHDRTYISINGNYYWYHEINKEMVAFPMTLDLCITKYGVIKIDPRAQQIEINADGGVKITSGIGYFISLSGFGDITINMWQEGIKIKYNNNGNTIILQNAKNVSIVKNKLSYIISQQNGPDIFFNFYQGVSSLNNNIVAYSIKFVGFSSVYILPNMFENKYNIFFVRAGDKIFFISGIRLQENNTISFENGIIKFLDKEFKIPQYMDMLFIK